MPIDSVIVEDEPAAREALKNYLAKYCPQVNLVGEAHNSKQAVELLHRIKPQLVFLDVEMPFGNAFDVLEACKGLRFETIFVTAFSEYSLRALNQSAAYYLLKPISIEELITAVDKVREEIEKEQLFHSSQTRNRIVVENFRESAFEKQQVILPTTSGFEVVRMEDMVRLRANGNFTDIYLRDGSKKMVCRFLKHYDDLLPEPFLRVHRSHIINTRYVRAYQKGNGGYASLIDGSEVEISARYKEVFLKWFSA